MIFALEKFKKFTGKRDLSFFFKISFRYFEVEIFLFFNLFYFTFLSLFM